MPRNRAQDEFYIKGLVATETAHTLLEHRPNPDRIAEAVENLKIALEALQGWLDA